VGPRAEQLMRIATDAPGLARAAAELLSEPARAAEMAARAREHARRHFSWEALGRELERVAREASDERSAETLPAAHGMARE